MDRKWAIVLAAILGLVAVFLTNIYFQQQEVKMKTVEGKKAQILVAAREISRGTTIDYDMLAMKTVPVNFIEPGAMRSREAAVGKAAVATIQAGEQVLVTKLIAPGTGLTLAVKTPTGKRAFTIGLESASAVGGMIRPGDHVDVLGIFSSHSVTMTLFQDILVLAVGKEMVPSEEGKAERKLSALSSASIERGTITLALTPQEVQVTTVTMQHGKIRLTLRPRMERGMAMPAVDLSNLPVALDINALLRFYIKPTKVEQAPTVEVIRGLNKEVTPLPAK